MRAIVRTGCHRETPGATARARRGRGARRVRPPLARRASGSIVSPDSVDPTGGDLPVRMNPRSISIACLVVAAALPLAARPARADAWLLSPGDHYSSIGSSYFSADSYHDLNGTRHPLDQGGLHEEKSLFSYNEFGWTKGRTFI